MKITELSLEKYGGISGRTIKIPQGAGLTLIYGANEAGKSTTLEAISDFLFGIPAKSTRGSLFGYEAMRVGAALEMGDGSGLSLIRRKGLRKTLSDGTNALDDTILSPALGAMTRDRYETLFGLNHETLRNGGERLLAADGDIGRLIVEAGGGLRTLVARLEELGSKANDLFDTRRSANRVFYQQLDVFDAADKAARGALLTRETFEQTRKLVEAAAAALTQHRVDQQSLRTQVAKLERVLRVAPCLRQLDGLNRQVAGYANVASYAPDFSDLARGLMADQAEAERTAKATAERLDQLQARMDALIVDPALTAAEQQIADLAERALHVSKARIDRPHRQIEEDEAAAKLTDLRQMIDLTPDADIAALMPDQAALNQLRSLADEMLERGPKLTAAQVKADELTAKMAGLDAAIEAAIRAGHHQAPSATSALFGSLASQAAALAAQQASWDEEEALSQSRAAALGFDNYEDLTVFICPSAEDVRAEKAACDALQKQVDEQAKRGRQAERDGAAATAAAAELQKSGTIASDASVAEARSVRAAAWSPIKSSYVAGELPADVKQRLQAADSLDAALSQADELTDRRTAEAERAAELAQAQRKLADAKAEGLVTDVERTALTAQLDARQMAWAESFPDLCAKYPGHPAALQFVQARQGLLDGWDAAREKSQNVRQQMAQLEPLVDQLEALEVAMGLDSSASFAVRVSAVQAAIVGQEKAFADHERRLRERDETAAQHKLALADLAALKTAHAAWDAAWPAATEALRLQADVSPQQAITAVTEWSVARGTLSVISQTRQRLLRMDEDEASLAEAMLGMAATLGLDASQDSVSAAQMLKKRAAENTTLRTQLTSLKPDYEEAKVAWDQSVKALDAAKDAVARLALSKGLEEGDDGALLAAAARADDYRKLMEQIAVAEETASQVGDGQDLGALRAEWAERDLDVVRGELDVLKSRAEELDRSIEEAILAEKSARDQLSAYLSQSEVNLAVATREAASAQMHLALERYLELTLARELVTQAMSEVRSEQQDPLIARAGALFAAMTLGEFAGIEADVDDKGVPIVIGRRANDDRALVQQMSDGTRDQLFLAFRLASIENYASATEALPFVADDILVHFDDERSRATLELLAEFGKTNQILLFTHHRSVRDMVAPLAEAGLANLVDLERAA